MEQVGGDHYKSDYQHWDWAVDMGLGPLEYGATRYLCRHWKKDGVKDLKKAKHFVEKLRELNDSGDYEQYNHIKRSRRSKSYIESMIRFVEENKLPFLEAHICHMLSYWQNRDDLFKIATYIDLLIDRSEDAAGSQSPSRAGMVAGASSPDVPGGAVGGIGGNDGPDQMVFKGGEPLTTICPMCRLEYPSHKEHTCGEDE